MAQSELCLRQPSVDGSTVCVPVCTCARVHVCLCACKESIIALHPSQ
jgi:hypothetical protein